MKITKMKELNFVPITMDNILLATETQMKFWSDECAFNNYLYAIKKGKPFWLVYEDDNLVGITGLYEYHELGEPQTIWLGWFGVLKEYRGCGYGKEILLKTINIAKDRGYKKLRLYSSKREDLCPNAVPFYTKLSQQFNGFVEDYTLEQLEKQRIVVSFSLDGKKISKWNNKPLHLHKDEEDQKDGYIKYLKMKEEHNKTKKTRV